MSVVEKLPILCPRSIVFLDLRWAVQFEKLGGRDSTLTNFWLDDRLSIVGIRNIGEARATSKIFNRCGLLLAKPRGSGLKYQKGLLFVRLQI